ncbi:hypothetical protein BJY21_002131 [Kineosphaera limosa]|uniref:Uncharacterized protein n=1 Tax=Kineosphaera limosa NBRC 100340 TaxID=1184609 RepID=K6WS06_9MICO|nr:hypothetical protein [Kineosphaera limosa]NYE00947.1 hypothetical protein [Kineosphaera limosa]GAB94857.1 hypothetical protein KILIM_013_00120 [Kineosphaera limosa NBRC 100340]
MSAEQNAGDDDLLSIAAESAAALLDTERRPWLVGVAHMLNHPLDSEFSAEAVQRVIDIATATTQFPSGPIDFLSKGFEQELNPDHRIITLRGVDFPNLELKIGFGIAGIAGIVAVGLTRSDILADGSQHPGAVVLGDLESVAADTTVLAIGAAIELGYYGPIALQAGVSYDGPGRELTYFAIDEDSARLGPVRSGVDRFTPVRRTLTFRTDSEPREVHGFLYEFASDISRQFGMRPQLVTNLFDEDIPEYGDDPLGHKARQA